MLGLIVVVISYHTIRNNPFRAPLWNCVAKSVGSAQISVEKIVDNNRN